jgi:hypothetical protein
LNSRTLIILAVVAVSLWFAHKKTGAASTGAPIGIDPNNPRFSAGGLPTAEYLGITPAMTANLSAVDAEDLYWTTLYRSDIV